MERLTEKAWRNLDPWECCGQDYYCKRGCHEEGGCTKGCIVPKLYTKLAAYEDLQEMIGIPFEEHAALCREHIPDGAKYPSKAIVLTDDSVDKWHQYKDAEEQGLLLRLPCKVGDWLYCPCSDYNVVVPVRLNNVSISFIGLENYSYQYNCCSFDGCGDVYEDYEFDNDDIGKTVFLTEEEAEQALKQMGE